ncbi:MAG TPA: GNAT family N-acetyltransferase [Candidatus Baltobacteraceae bacterium]|jgi:GNAT superfamily N-acetyltransferase
MGITIDRATSEHLDAVTPLFDAYRRFFTHKDDTAVSESFIGARLAVGDSVIFLAFEDGEAVGFIQLYPLFSSWYARRIWFLSDLYVAEEARKRSIGRALVRRVVEYAEETEASSVMVELPFSEPHLQRFYSSFGFAKDDIFELYRLKVATA